VKPPVPQRADKPLMGLTSNKDFITSNASELPWGMAETQPHK
jgi:hypothetical protein